MIDTTNAGVVLESLACQAGALLAVDPEGLGGAVLLRPSHEAARAWVARVRELSGSNTPLRRLPVNASDDRVLGGLDIAATLAFGRRVVMRGILSEADGGLLVLPLAERALSGTVAALAAALDSGQVVVERDGVAARHDSRITVIAIDETGEGFGDVHIAPSLADRLAFQLQLPYAALDHDLWPTAKEIRRARERLMSVELGTAARELCALSDLLGISSIRSVVMAMRASRALAALAGRLRIETIDLEVAVQLVMAPRATQLPPPADAPCDAEPDEATPGSDPEDGDDAPANGSGLPDEILLAAVRALLPPDVLEASAAAARRRSQSAGRRGRERAGGERGRQLRSTPGVLDGGRKLDPVATLRSAAPWQPIRRRERESNGTRRSAVLDVRRDDFRVRRYKRQTGTTTIIAVDASGSMALHRLAEAKGAVELLLAQSYVRRDKVALVAFRGNGAVLLLPPTRALARAKRMIASLPGGGGTPLASAIELVHITTCNALREGQDVVAVWLTDARANIALDGTAGRVRAMEDAQRAARNFAHLGQTAVVIDTSPRGEVNARELATAMAGRYVPLPSAQAGDVARAVRAERPVEMRR